MDKERIKIVALSANIDLANKIAKHIGVEIMPSALTHFSDGEILFEGQKSFRGDNVYIVQSTCNPVNERLMELLVCIDACRRAGANTITCVIPYFGYSRQDRKAKARQPITCKLVADLITVAGADKVICVDLHASQTQGFFNIPLDDISAMPLFYKYISKLDLQNAVCVSPDHGGVVRTSILANKLGLPIAIIDKRRPRPNESEVIGIVGEVENKTCIIIDDIIDTAGTLCKAAAKLKELGAKKIIAAASHGVLSGNAIQNINDSVIDKILITDSIPFNKNVVCDRIQVLPLASILAKIIIAIEKGTSVSEALEEYAKESFGE